MIAGGWSRKEVVALLGVGKSTLAEWINQHLKTGKTEPALPGNPKPVSSIRSLLRMVDAGVPLRVIARETGSDRKTIRTWRDEPRFREATLEYDPSFTYDHTDMLDRAVVAHHLCTQTNDRDERMSLLLAVIGTSSVDDPVKRGYGRAISNEGD